MHLGGRLGRDVLRIPAALDALLEAVAGADRLVLLGDLVELLESRARDAMAVAEPVLRAIGARVGRDGEVLVVPGNHDAALVRPWVRAHRSALRIETEVPRDATPLLAQVVDWLGPARVRVRYPGVWLSDGVWATHGHYLDRHLLPDSAYGIARGLLGRLPRDGALPEEYEQGGPSLTRIEASLTGRLPRPLARLAENASETLRARTMPAPLTARLLGLQMRRAAMPALARVVHRLGVDADWVVFGHVHRCGPVEGEDTSAWAGPQGRPRIVNTGSWVYEAGLLHRASPPHPYWPGGAVLLEEGAEPRALRLLDHLDAGVLAPR